MNNSSLPTSDPSVSAEAPLPAPVHEFIVRVADKGPSTRALAIVSIVGVSLFAISLLALPRKSAPIDDPVTAKATQPAIAPMIPPASAPAATPVAAAVERPGPSPLPTMPTMPARTMSPPSPAVPAFDAAPPAPVTPTVAAAPRVDPPPMVVNAPGVPEAPRPEVMPVGATSRAPIELIAAPAPAPREAEITPSVPRDALTPRPPPE